MSSFLYSLGRKAFAARKTVLVVWLLILAVTGAGAGLLNKGLDNTVTIPGTEAQQALDRLSVTFPQTSGAAAQVVVVSPDGVRNSDVRDDVERAVDEFNRMDQVSQAIAPYNEQLGGTISEDGQAGLLSVQMTGSETEITDSSKDRMAEITEDLQQRLPEGSQAAHGGPLFATEFPGLSIIEGLGLVVAIVVLVITLGSFLAAGMPLLNALLGVGVSTALIFLTTVFGPITATTPLLSLMLGLAVGIDYALFIVSRHQQELHTGASAREATARAVATAGSAVIFAGLTVIIALAGLSVAGIPFLTTMGLAAAVAVAVAVLVSLTLVPALLGFAGDRLRPREPAKRTRRTRSGWGTRFFSGWVRAATRFPLVTVLAVVGILGIATAPAMGLRLALPDTGALPEDDPARVTYDLVSEHFAEGYNGPLVVTANIVTNDQPLRLMNDLKGEIERLPGVADVPMATPNPTADTGIVQVLPRSAPDSEETKRLVDQIRSLRGQFQDDYGVNISVTGSTAVGIDVSSKLGAALLPFGLVVVGLSLVLLMMVFRSIAVPVKASLGYLLTIGSSLGIVTLVFQNGWLAGLFNVPTTGPVISFMPIVLMGVLFGLAMDYELFLVSRIREEFVHTGDAQRSITTGFVSSARVVTAAAAIMFAVFIAFVPGGDANLKPIALGLAVGVFIDAFVVRMTLVPAVLALLKHRAWWLPRSWDRVLPSFDVEGENLREEQELANWPQPGADHAVACEALRLVDSTSERPIFRDVGFLVPKQGTHVVRATHEPVVTALLLTVSGRVKPTGGKLKVFGYVLPARASAARAHVAYIDVGDDGSDGVRRALAEDPDMLVLDRTDRLADPGERERVRELLGGTTTAVLLGTTGSADVRDLLPTTVLATFTELPDDRHVQPDLVSDVIR